MPHQLQCGQTKALLQDLSFLQFEQFSCWRPILIIKTQYQYVAYWWTDFYGHFVVRWQVFHCPIDSDVLICCEVFIFTFLLFLSGYILQQQTVRSIQAAIKPPTPPSPLQSTDPTRVVAKHFGDPNINSAYEKFLATNKPKGGWAKVAYVQLIREHLHVCNAAMLFAELGHEESMARKVMLYPKEWHTQHKGSETSLRILKNAEKRYKVELQPVDRIQASAKGMMK